MFPSAVSPSRLRSDRVAFDLLFQSGDPHLEEFIEIGADDAEELQPFQQRIGGVQRLVEHALVEFQPAQLAIEKVLRLKFLRFHVALNGGKHSVAVWVAGKVTIP